MRFPSRRQILLPCLLTLSSTALAQTDTHHVRSHFEATDAPGELAFRFEVEPPVRSAPIVRWLGDTAHADLRTLEVSSAPDGRYEVRLTDLPTVTHGRLQIEVVDPDTGWFELHVADFALREHATGAAGSRPGHDGNFVVLTSPESLPADGRLLLTTDELPLDGLPDGVSDRDVAAAYSLELLPAAETALEWVLSVGTPSDSETVLYHRPRGETAWQAVDSAPLPQHSARLAAVHGPGTWLLVRVTP